MMTNQGTDHGRYHVLLIGIDAYAKQPLKGCVNDIDSIQRLLVERANVPASEITRLVSPHTTYVSDMTIEAKEATLENIVAALVTLGSDEVGPTDRVLIYYAGHGTRIEVDDVQKTGFRGATTRFHEALVPVDASLEGPTLLLDFELNALLAKIANRTKAVTVILDCCHSSGATRSLEPSGSNTRFIDLSDDGGHSGPVTMTDERAQLVPSTVPSASPDLSDESGSVDDCQIVAACLNHELAKETPRIVAEGETRSGLLTRSLVEALSQVPDDELTTATWSRFWHQVRAKIETDADTPAQHSWMSGGLARQWLAGPPNDGDAGLGITRTEGRTNEYSINAGTVAGITKGARIAVYGHEPHKFPPLGTPEDESARIGSLLEVTDASASAATATATDEPFDLPPGARARLAQAGVSERLLVAVIPDDAAVVAAVGQSDLLEVTDTNRAHVRLEQLPDGDWVLTDDVHGARPGDPVLASLRPDEVAGEARRVVEHYIRYAGPIRMAQRCGDLPNALQISLLDCPVDMQKDHKIVDAEIPNLRETAIEPDGSYALQHGAEYCVRIHNASRQKLLVHLFNSDASGQVASLGHQEIDGQTTDYFWAQSETGSPFWANVDGQPRCIDRFVAIGTTDMGADLKHLEEVGKFRGGTRAVGTERRPTAPPAVEWTAAGVIVRTDAPAS